VKRNIWSRTVSKEKKQMKLACSDFGNILMKFCEKPEYAKDIVNGHIYMKEIGYFRKLEDPFRGDPYDGQIHIQEEYGISRKCLT
jgi:hypothetical protein